MNEKSESSHRIDDDNVRVFFAAFSTLPAENNGEDA